MESTTKTYRGSCHCGVVQIEVDADLKQAARCNCTICTKVGSTGIIVKPAAFRLLAGEDQLGVYEWGAKVSRRFFCKVCGIHVFGRGHLAQLGGDYVSVNVNALDDVDLREVPLVHWDGRHNNWQAGPRTEPWPIASASA